ncbi:MAG TPA: serine hydrolase domain-containing protein [Nocardioidaceae bacterium]|nr:serine hydrolase domain-containing protein [Nocardioidaceae bacterium]
MSAEERLAASLRDVVGTSAPGVVVVGPDGVRASSAIGRADLVTRAPMTDGVVMPWFSMTKIATATTAIRLVEREILALDAPLSVPALELLRPGEWAERITLRHLLQHTAGLANPVPVRWIHPADRPGPAAEDFLARLLRKHPKLRFEPGSRSSYTNLGALVVGAVVAHASGTPFESVVQREVLGPVGMSSTGFAFGAGSAATGYHPRRGPMRRLLPRWVLGEPVDRWVGLRPFLLDGAPYGGLVGTAADAARFLQMHLADGQIDGTRVISVGSATEMRHVNTRGRRFDLGLGWFVPARDRSADPPYVEHLGAGAGFFNVMRMYPTEQVGAVVMGNATKYDVDAVARLALDSRG